MHSQELDQLAIDTIRTLSIDAVQQAKSGHPGTPMGFAPVVYTLWNRRLRFDPKDPLWPDRDRFVLSNGHACMLLWSVLHLSSTVDTDGRPAVSLEDIRRFRQLDSKATGHPEYRHTAGVETTTGPLGQGLATSVGMAIARHWLAAHYNRPGFALFDHDIYAICGDGCLMEGISSEAASIAGHLGLDSLCWIYDRNHVTIDGNTRIAFTEDVGTRFLAYGWHVLRVGDANDLQRVDDALQTFRSTRGKPTLIIVDSHIGFGSPHKVDTAAAHGEPLGQQEARLAKRAYGWPEDAQFMIPAGVCAHFDDGIGARGADARAKWNSLFDDYGLQNPELAGELKRMWRAELPAGWDRDLPSFGADTVGLAGREASGKMLNALARNIPWMVGGSADLAGSNRTLLTFEGAGSLQAATPGGRNLHFGIREHAMVAIVSGMALSHLRSFGGTFLVFSDYAKAAIRLSAMMKLPTLLVFTHDGLGDGEDGPTHQPVGQLLSLRAVPGLTVLRPGDANEVVEAYRYALQQKQRPTAMVLSRQALPTLDRRRYAPAAGLARGAYILADPREGVPQVILIASGSELLLAVQAHETLEARGVRSRLVSMPSWDIFEQQPQSYRADVLPAGVGARIAIEQGSPLGWDRYVGPDGTVLGMHSFGASAPLPELQRKFGFEPERVVASAMQLLGHG